MLSFSSRKNKKIKFFFRVVPAALALVICVLGIAYIALFSGEAENNLFHVRRLEKIRVFHESLLNIDEGIAADFIRENSLGNKIDIGNFPTIYPTGEWLNSNTGKDGEARDHILKETAMMGDDYFKNTLFLGDSRMVGLGMSSSDIGATFYAGVGLSVSQLGKEKIISGDAEEDYTVLEAIENDGRNYDRVYMMFGLNELGWGSSSVFIRSYRTAIEQVKALCPDAQICVISIIPVSPTAKVSGVANGIEANKKIREYNSLILELAAEKDIWYLDAHGFFADESGMLPEDFSRDGIHFGSSHNKELIKFIASHAFAP